MAFIADFTGRRDDATLTLNTTAADAIVTGDAMWWDAATQTARPAGAQADQLTLLANQQLFAINFLGIARTDKLATVVDTVVVDVSQRMLHQFPATSAVYRFGTYVNLNEIAAGTALDADQLIAVVNREDAIAVVVDDNANARTSIQVRFFRSVAMGNFGAPRAQFAAAALGGAQVLTLNSPPILNIDPAGNVNVDLPAEATAAGRVFFIKNTADAAETITVRDDTPATVITIAQDEAGIVWCDGTTWQGMIGTET